MITSDADRIASPPDAGKARGGRPTRAAAAERDERLLEIATDMFMTDGFDATSMDRLAETAAIGKATLYARYADKAALFAAVLRRGIMQVYEPMEDEFRQTLGETDLETALRRIAHLLLRKSLSPKSIALGRILSAQGPRFPDLAQLAIEGLGRQLRLVEGVLAHFAPRMAYTIDDLPLAADLFVSLVQGRAARLAMYGVAIDSKQIDKRADEAVGLFVRGLLKGGS